MKTNLKFAIAALLIACPTMPPSNAEAESAPAASVPLCGNLPGERQADTSDSLTQDAIAKAMAGFDRQWLNNNGDWYTAYDVPKIRNPQRPDDLSDRIYVQAKNVCYQVSALKISTGFQLDGYEWKGSIKYRAKVAREWALNEWSSWKDGVPFLLDLGAEYASKKAGNWQVVDGVRGYFPVPVNAMQRRPTATELSAR